MKMPTLFKRNTRQREPLRSEDTDKPPFVGEKVRVSEVFDLQMGKTPSRKNLSYWNNGDYDWVSIKDLGSYDRFVGRTKETISELGRVESGIRPVPANTIFMSGL